MPREPDPRSPATDAQLEPGDCIADVAEELLEETAAYHGHAEPEPTPVEQEDLV